MTGGKVPARKTVRRLPAGTQMSDIGQLLSHHLMEGRSYVLPRFAGIAPIWHTTLDGVVFHKQPEQGFRK